MQRVYNRASASDVDSEPVDMVALKKILDSWASELESTSGKGHLAEDVCRFLLTLHEDKSVEIAAQELLRQGTVLLWGAFEVLSRDLFIRLVNTDPALGRQFIKPPDGGKRIFDIKAFDFDTLASFQFDISGSLGSILASKEDISDLARIKSVYNVIFPEDSDLREALSDRDLWVLAQRRHLIVHNRGVVDRRYIDNTGEELPIGTELHIDPRTVEHYAVTVQKAAKALAMAAIGRPVPEEGD